jgi:hypothetical protein
MAIHFSGRGSRLTVFVLLLQVCGMGQICPPSWSGKNQIVQPPPPPPGSELEKKMRSEPLRPSQVGGKWGYIDPTGTFLIPPQFDCAEPFSDGLGIVVVKNRFGYIATDGHFVIEPKFPYARKFHEGFAWVITRKPRFPLGHGEYGVALFAEMTFIDKSGREILRPFDAGLAEDFSEGLAALATSHGLGYISTKGEWTIKAQFAEAGNFSEGLAAVKRQRLQQDDQLNRQRARGSSKEGSQGEKECVGSACLATIRPASMAHSRVFLTEGSASALRCFDVRYPKGTWSFKVVRE